MDTSQADEHPLSNRARRDTALRTQEHYVLLLYQEHCSCVYRYMYRSVHHRQDAEDLTAQVFLKALSSVDETRPARTLRRWLLEVIRTTLADYWRTRARLPTCSLEALVHTGWQGPMAAPTTASREAADQVARLLEALPARYREVLTHRFLLDLSVRETALSMGITEANVKVLQLRALKRAAALASGLSNQ